MAFTDAWIGVVSESPIGKHFVWSNGLPLKYTNWRDLHPTHQDIVGADQEQFSRSTLSKVRDFESFTIQTILRRTSIARRG